MDDRCGSRIGRLDRNRFLRSALRPSKLSGILGGGMNTLKRSAIIASALVVASCQTTAPTTSSITAAFAPFPVTCPWRATFPGAMEFKDESSIPGLPPGTKRLVVRSKADYRQFAVTCFCNDSFNFSRLKEQEALGINSGALQADQWQRTEYAFSETGSRKEFSYTAKVDNFAGPHIRKGRVHFQGTCATSVEAYAPLADVASVEGFIRSIWDVRDVATAPSASVAPNGSAETRLATIKDLLDRKVITQQEYDERRRAILGSL